MKKKMGIVALLVVVVFVLIGCNNAFGVLSQSILVEGGEVENIETPIVEENVEISVNKENFISLDTSNLNILEKTETVIVEKIEKPIVTDIDSFVDFVENVLNENVVVFNHETNYYSDYLDEYISESAEIVIEKGDFYPLYMTVLFKDSKLLNVVLTYNKRDTDNGMYFDFINKLYATLGYNCGLSEEKSEEMITELMNFDNYSNNVYDNPEYNGYFNNIYCLGVVFAEGKDFIFDGYTYYFSFFVNDYFVENEV